MHVSRRSLCLQCTTHANHGPPRTCPELLNFAAARIYSAHTSLCVFIPVCPPSTSLFASPRVLSSSTRTPVWVGVSSFFPRGTFTHPPPPRRSPWRVSIHPPLRSGEGGCTRCSAVLFVRVCRHSSSQVSSPVSHTSFTSTQPHPGRTQGVRSVQHVTHDAHRLTTPPAPTTRRPVLHCIHCIHNHSARSPFTTTPRDGWRMPLCHSL